MPDPVAQLMADLAHVPPHVLLNAIRSGLRLREVTSQDFQHHDVFTLVYASLESNAGRLTLIEVVRSRPDTSESAAEIAQLLYPAAPLLDEPEFQRILALLHQCAVDNLGALFHAATQGSALSLPSGLATLPALFMFLTDSNTRPGTLPPALRLVAYAIRNLVYQQGPVLQELVTDLRTWLYRQCDRLRDVGDTKAAVELDDLLRNPPPFPREDFPVSLIVELDRLPAPNDQRDLFQIRHWRQTDHTRWQPVAMGSENVPRAQVPRRVYELISEAEEEWARKERGPLVLEFLLSPELINLGVDQWPQDMGNGLPPRKLGLDYEVVIRSDSRLRPLRRHRDWRARWERCMSGAGVAHLAPLHEEVDLAGLHHKLRVGDHLVALVLSTPPDQEPGRTQLRAAMDAGLPIVLWSRNSAQNNDFCQSLRAAVQSQQLRRLPTSVRHIRSTAVEICDNFALLWDDPNHRVASSGQLKRPN
ncbi:hypothetical protein [Nonomuraea typhae]|uniref:Uncharacterized protein n=1 Tax=Nonomuraea typhae TaxID=2603600 RepID=A0ABW7ZB07_9ACTN